MIKRDAMTQLIRQSYLEIWRAARLSILLALAVALSACARPTVKRLTDERYPRKTASEEIELYIGGYDGAHEVIAELNSISLPEKDDLAKSRQIDYLKKRARELGADAIEDIRLLPREVRGYVLDENVPFRSWKQGVYYVYFLRGTAIRYVDDKDNPYAFEKDYRL